MLSTLPSRRITAYKITSPSTRSLTSDGGYFGSTFFNGTGPARSPDVTRGASGLLRSSLKFRIQLPVELFRLGMLTFKLYTRFVEKITSGFAPAGRAAKFGGPTRSGTSSSIFG